MTSRTPNPNSAGPGRASDGCDVDAPFPLLVASLMLVAANAAAEPPASSSETEAQRESPGSTERVAPRGLQIDAPWLASFTPQTERSSDNWRFAIGPSDSGGPYVETSVPAWATPPDYRLDVRAVALTDDDVAVLATFEPDPDHREDTTGVTLQIAWHADRAKSPASESSREWSWRLAARVQHSELEGGQRLSLRRDEGEYLLVQRQRDATPTICGPERPGHLAQSEYDPRQQTFVQRMNLDQYLGEAEPLEAKVPEESLAGPFTRGVYQWYWASSEASRGSPGGTVRPMEMGDRRAGSIWSVAGGDDLRGEYATAHVTEAVPVESVRIVPGWPQSKGAYQKLGRPKQLLFRFSDGSSYVVDLPDVPYQTLVGRRGIVVDLPSPKRTSCISVVHLAAYPGEEEADEPAPVAIAELTPVTSVDDSTPAGTAKRIVEAIASEEDLRARREIAHMATALGDELADAIRTAVAQREGTQRRRVIPLLANLDAEDAVPILMEFLRELPADAVEYRAVKRTLAAHDRRAAAPLAEFVRETSHDGPKYVDLIRLLGRVGRPEHLEALIDDLGSGDRKTRDERIRAIARGERAVLGPLFQAVETADGSAQRRDALKGIYVVGRHVEYDGLADHEDTGVVRKILRTSEDRRTLLLAFRTARHFRVDELPRLLENRFLDWSDPLVRAGAAATAGRYPSDRARRLLERMLTDASPDVRIAAIAAIADRDDRRASVSAILDYVRREDWREGRKQAIGVLAEIDHPETQSFFHQTLAEHRDSDHALYAANALDRAERAISAELARDIARDESAADRLRLEMIDLLGLDDSAEGEDFLMGLLDPAEHGLATEDNELRRRFSRRALLSLGRRRSERARSRLLSIAREGTEVGLRRHAIRALAFYDGEDLVEALDSWRSEAPPALRPTVDQTMRIIENRAAIDEVDRQIEATMEAEEQRDAAGETDDQSSESPGGPASDD